MSFTRANTRWVRTRDVHIGGVGPPSEALNLCVVVVRRAKDERGAERRVQGCPEGAGEARVAIGDEQIGQAHVTEHGSDVVASRSLGSSGLEGRDQPYAAGTSALRGTADTLLDAASYGARWVLLSPAPAAGVVRALRSRAPRPDFEFGRWLVTVRGLGPRRLGPGPGWAGQRKFGQALYFATS